MSGKKNRRFLSGLVVDPDFQIRVALQFSTFAQVVVLGCVSVFFYYNLSYVKELASTGGYPVAHSIADRLEMSGRILLLGVLAITILSGVFAFRNSHRIAGPIRRFQNHIRALAEGRTAPPIILRKDDEFKSLADDLNRLTEVLSRQSKS